jgi:hypothetical protein
MPNNPSPISSAHGKTTSHSPQYEIPPNYKEIIWSVYADPFITGDCGEVRICGNDNNKLKPQTN